MRLLGMASGPAVIKGCLDSCTGLEAALPGPPMAPESTWSPSQSEAPWHMWVLSHCGCCCQVASVMPDSVRPHRRQPTRLRSPWDSLGKNTGVGCHFLLRSSQSTSEQNCYRQNCVFPRHAPAYMKPQSLMWLRLAFMEVIKVKWDHEGGALIRPDW